ncbi:MAG: DUF5696 domain-containing protein [Fervidobacterium sp.]|nr:DUF5696 domain-containing protein [Fervidobacterium sp.]
MQGQNRYLTRLYFLIIKFLFILSIIITFTIWIKNVPEQSTSMVYKKLDDSPYQFVTPKYGKTFETQAIRTNVDTKTMNFTVEDKKSGFVWKSALENEDSEINTTWRMFFNSALVVEFYDEVGGVKRLYSSKDADIKLEKEEKNSLTFAVKFRNVDIFLRLILSFNNDSADVVVKDIKESTYKVMGLFIYPYLGGSKGLADGRFILADGVGAIVELSKVSTATAPFKMRIYGEDIGFREVIPQTYFRNIKEPSSYVLPMYGILYNQNGLLAIFKNSEEYVEINAYKSGIITPYNWLSGRFVFRDIHKKLLNKQGQGITIPQENMNPVKPHIRYYFLSDSNEYTLANKFISEYAEQISSKNSTEPIFKIDVLMSEAKKTAFGYTLVKMTTQEQLEKIKNELSHTLDNVVYVLRGYSKDGYSRNSPYHLPFEQKIINSLEKIADDYIYVDYVKFPKISKFARRLIVAQNKLEQLIEREENFLTDPILVSKIATEEKQKFKRFGISNLALGTIGEMLYSTKNLERSKTKNLFEKLIGLFEKPIIYGSNWYLLKNSYMIADLTLENSGYEIENDVFPIVPFVLSNFRTVFSKPINLSADYRLQLLKCIEYGVMPSFYLTWESSKELVDTNSQHLISTKFNDWREEIKKSYLEYKNIKNILGKNRPIKRTKLYENVYIVDYENNVSIIFNYNSSTITYKNHEISGVSWKIIRGEQ